ncbi:hypothetical protein Metev_0651 [Methanohalobium evestigatum Z-7303]|uniref:Uncharacterized protein n=1 Tax=Methanohalobium evestigatum (strain ATCC BAA-1072 / DSM 3721 / NBRC 107634 / OCM 161 / Z-7303) TaxID=644295 RepID=D7E6T3_METEZ|nr:hypothetical protein [Methanohalobium evestigatum]ADI73557.1 hypothetical protein Metev_0651 [Methanohalobium evestigatum Z-7303]
MSVLPLLQEHLTYPFLLLEPPQTKGGNNKRDCMIYKSHSKSAAEEGDPGYDAPVYVSDTLTPYRLLGVSKLPAAETTGYHDSHLHVKGGDKAIPALKHPEIIGKELRHYHEFGNVLGIASKTLSGKDMDGYLIGGIWLVSNNWYPVGIGYHLGGIDTLIPSVKASLYKESCKNGLNN